MLRNTGIICTIGPKTQAPDKLTMLRQTGMNVMRMNFSHGSHAEHAERVANLRESVKVDPLTGRLCAIALDTKGPEIRTGNQKTGSQGESKMVMGTTVTVTTDEQYKQECCAELIWVDYKNLPKVMKVGDLIYIDDGLLSLKVTSIDNDKTLKCEVMNTAMLGSHKGCNLPEVDVDLPALSEKDKSDLAWGVSQEVDMVFASFIRKASDVREVRECLVAADPVYGKRIRIISKIENHEGMRNFDEVLQETDGVMVARGDLGIEIPPEKVFIAQKMMISKCNKAGKPVICATQMLESMTFNPRPTRAEVSDVANAVLDGADCVMLSGETAKGKYPMEAVGIMAQTCLEAEAAVFQAQLMQDMAITLPGPLPLAETVAKACVDAAASKDVALIITITITGGSARLISKYRPRCPVLVLASDANVGAACNLHRGCIPIFNPHGGADFDVERSFALGIKYAAENKLVNAGDSVALAHGSPGQSLTTFRLADVLDDCTIEPELPFHPSTSCEAVVEELTKMDSLPSVPLGPAQAKAQKATCVLDHNTKLDIYSVPGMLRNTGIICTIGPKTQAPDKLTMLRQTGMNVMRMNFSHGSHAEHAERVANLRESVKVDPLTGRLCAIALDTKGPEIRTGNQKTGSQGESKMVMGTTVTVTTDEQYKQECCAELIWVDYKNLPKVMKVGDLIYIDDGLLSLKVTSIDNDKTLKCEVMNTAMLGSHKGCNLPEVDVDLPALSEKDKSDLAWGVSQEVDMVFASFIRKASDVREVRECLVAADPVYGKRIRIISKIENHEGMRNFDEVLQETDGVMVARGDLGIEIPPEKVFIAQKMMISKCNKAGKPVICATQMLESMTFNPRPTRAEVSDVANAVLDGADCVMLSGETAKGKYPMEAVGIMAQTCLEAEAAVFQRQVMSDLMMSSMTLGKDEAVAKAVVDAATSKAAALIITLSTSGNSARLISKYRPRCPILVLSRDPHLGAMMNLHRGCIPFLYPHPKPATGSDVEDRFEYALKLAVSTNLAKPGDAVVLCQGAQRSVRSLTTFSMATV